MFRKTVAAVMISAVLGSGAAFAADAKKPVTLDEAVAIATKAYPGTVEKKEKERGLLEVYIKTEKGEKVLVKIDPKTGDIVSPKQKK